MKKLYLPISFLVLIIVTVLIYGCSKLYVNHGFRKTYTDVNDVIHSDPLNNPFFKVHLKNGDVSLFDNWQLNETKDSINGQGQLFDFNRNQRQTGELSVGLDDIAIIETNDLRTIKSKDDDRITGLTILTAANAALDIVCITNPKACFGSCPTFYVEDNTAMNTANAEGFSSAISPSLEYRDLDALKYSTSKNTFDLTMTNEAFETHMINELYLQAVPKKDREQIFHDKQGSFYICGDLIPFSSAVTNDKDISVSLNSLDDKEYFSDSDREDLTAKEAIVLEFKDPIPENKGLVINFRQSLLTTYLLYSGISYMGNQVGDYFAKIETNRHVKDRLKNPFKRLGTIKLYAWNNTRNKWILFGDLYETGPIAKNLMLAPLPKNIPHTDILKIKVELTKGLWRLDYLGLTAITTKTSPLTIYPNKLDVVTGEAYTVDKIITDDDSYLVSLPGNEYTFQFELPGLPENTEYELFLSSKGYYLEWVRSEWLQNKDLVKLRKMLLNDKQTWNELAREFKTKEHEMETVFWNSKYTNTNN